MIRKAVPLEEADLQAVEQARQDGILAELAGGETSRSEPAALTALIRLGLKAVNETRQLRGYDAWAASMDEEDVAYRAAMRGRRRSPDA